MKKVLLFSLVILFLTSCASKLTTTRFQSLKWTPLEQSYQPISDPIPKTAKFKLKKKEITITLDNEYTIDVIEYQSTIDEENENTPVKIYDGYIDGKIPCRVTFYKKHGIIIIYENLDEIRFQSFVIFAK